MPPTVILVRHAQALHNVAGDWQIRDPGLSELGFEQCQKLREVLRTSLPGKLDAQLVVVSPMKRTLQTAMASLDWLHDTGVPFVAHAGWQETTTNPCDVGSPLADLAEAFPGVDFSEVDPVFPDKTSPEAQFYAFNRWALVARAQAVLAELHKRPEAVVIVVSHSAFLSKAVSGSMYANADFRIFSFDEPKPEAAAAAETAAADSPQLPPLVYRLKEWDDTRYNHGGMGWSVDEVRAIGAELPAA